MYLYVIDMSLVFTRMSPDVTRMHSYVISMSFVCHQYVTRMYSYVNRMSLVCTRMSSLCHLHALVCHLYVTRMYSYIIRMSLICGFTMNPQTMLNLSCM